MMSPGNFAAVAAVSVLGATVTQALNHDLRLGAVRASAGASCAFVVGTFWMHHGAMPELRAAFLGATFAGMCEPGRFTRVGMAVCGLVFAALYAGLLSAPMPERPPGGLLGTSAFLASLMVAAGEWVVASAMRAARSGKAEAGLRADTICRN